MILAVSLLIPLEVLRAETLPELVQYLTQEHNLVKAAEEDVNAARQRARVALGDWFPTLDVSTSYGFEDQVQPGAADTRFVTRDVDLKVTQLLWDFGKTNAALRRAGLVLEQTLAVLDGVRQNILLRGVTAYLNVSRRTQILEFAKRSEENIKKQADLENALVQAGKGFSTDVLQAKARLAGAEARRIDAHGRFERAKNDFRALFERTPDNIYSQGIVHLPIESLPLTLEDAVETAIQFNPVLKSESFTIKIAQEDVNSTRSDSFFPRLQGVVEQRYKKDFSGTVGFQRESLGKVELSFPFNLGFTSVNKLRAAKHDRSATVRRVADRKDLVEQQTRDAWTNMLTARQRTTSLRNQAEIVMRFLEDARKERKAGRRSLLDVLDGETQLLNAQSDAASAEIDSAIAIFTLFEAMGQLTESVILGRKSGEYLPEPRLSLDFGKLRNGGIKTRAVQKIAPPSNKIPEFVFPLIHQDPADEEPKVEARHQADKEAVSELVASEINPKQNPEAEPGIYGLEQAEALRAENEPGEPAPGAADSESPIYDLLASIGRFFESAGDSGDTVKSESVKTVVIELEAPPETSVTSEKERSLTADSTEASLEQDQAPEADSGLSGPEQTAALGAENEPAEPEPGAADSESLIYDLLARLGRFFESAGDSGEIIESEPVKAVVAELEAPAETSPETSVTSEKERSLTADPVDASLEQDQVPEADSGLSGSEQTAALRAENEPEEPGLGDLVSTVITWL
ncbi:MAG: TolC family protein, partial [Nitrospinae bacterium]|nr:TolC family protein [Nitrospinota bacterium]